MNILAFTLAHFGCSIALAHHNKVISLSDNNEYRGQDLTLLPLIQQGLKEHGLHFHDLDFIMTATGPGSFTGIRVALATAQGLALATGIPALGINSFDLFYHKYRRDFPKSSASIRQYIVVLESLRTELYVQAFDEAGNHKGMPSALSPQELEERYNDPGYLLMGNGVGHLPRGDWTLSQPSSISAVDLIMSDAHLKDKALYPCVPHYVRDADTTKPI